MSKGIEGSFVTRLLSLINHLISLKKIQVTFSSLCHMTYNQRNFQKLEIEYKYEIIAHLQYMFSNTMFTGVFP